MTVWVRGWDSGELIYLLTNWDMPLSAQASDLSRTVGSVQSRRQRIREDRGLLLLPSRTAKRAYLTDYMATLAFHEAGHAWAEVATGGEFREIWVGEEGSDDYEGGVIPACERMTSARADITCFSGLVAETIQLESTHPHLEYADLLHACIRRSRDGDLENRGDVSFLTDAAEMRRLRDAITGDWSILQTLVTTLLDRPVVDGRQSMTFDDACPLFEHVKPYPLPERRGDQR